MSALRLDIIRRDYPEGVRFTWRLWAGSRIVASSGSQLYSRRIDCVDGAAIATNTWNLRHAVKTGEPVALRPLFAGDREDVEVRLVDERGKP